MDKMKALHINVGKSGQVVGALESFVTERLVGRTLDIPVGLIIVQKVGQVGDNGWTDGLV